MKALPPLVLAAWLATSCQKEAIPVTPTEASANPLTQAFFASTPRSTSIKNVSSVDLARVATSKEPIKFTVSLNTASGTPLANGSLVQPNTVYQVAVHGQSAARFILKMAEGFEIIQSPAAVPSENAAYLIRTTSEVSDKLYLSVVPLRTENGTLTKRAPTNFLLPN